MSKRHSLGKNRFLSLPLAYSNTVRTYEMLLTYDLHKEILTLEYLNTQNEQCLQQPNTNFHYSHDLSKLGIHQQ